MEHLVQLAGAILILAAYVLSQLRVLDPSAWGYLWPNLVGSAVLTADAWYGRQWGFFLLEGVWAIVTAWSMVAKARSAEPGESVMIDFAAKQVMTFDCYGTLIDWETGLLAAAQPILSRDGSAFDPERVLALFGEIESKAEASPYRPYRDVLAAVLPELGRRLGVAVSADDAARFADSVGEWPAFSDTPGALAALARRFKLAIVSNVDDDLFARSSGKLGVPFDWIVTAQQVRSYKPAPSHFHEALARIGRPKGAVLHVAQSLYHDHVPAKQLGLDTVWVNRRQGRAGAGATPPASATPDLEVPDLATLARLATAG